MRVGKSISRTWHYPLVSSASFYLNLLPYWLSWTNCVSGGNRSRRCGICAFSRSRQEGYGTASGPRSNEYKVTPGVRGRDAPPLSQSTVARPASSFSILRSGMSQMTATRAYNAQAIEGLTMHMAIATA